MAAQLKNEPELEVEVVRGGLGELSVRVDEREVFRSKLYPSPATVVEQVHKALA